MAHIWSLSDIPDMSGKTAIITGGNTGLGFKTALELARHGAAVMIGSRNPENGKQAVARVRAEITDAKISYGQLELTKADSIKNFAARFLDTHSSLDILFHNAGLVIHPSYEVTQEGRELQMQINHLGHFALTCHLMPVLKQTENARIVQSTTVPYHKGDIDFDDFDWARREYKPMQVYFDSRLAQLLFAHTLNQKFLGAGLTIKAISMQPGLVNTEGLQNSEFGGWIMKALAQPLEKGCRTHLRCATDPGITGENFWEPRFTIKGKPTPKTLKAPARDTEAAMRLLEFSQELTNTHLKV